MEVQKENNPIVRNNQFLVYNFKVDESADRKAKSSSYLIQKAQSDRTREMSNSAFSHRNVHGSNVPTSIPGANNGYGGNRPMMYGQGGMQSHWDKAHSVCGHIDDLVAALTELYDDNAKWKSRRFG